MGMGALATINAQQPKNLTIVVLDNGHFGETGMQHSHSSLGTDLTAVSKACGIANSFKVKDPSEVKTIQQNVLARAGVAFAQVYVKADDLPRALPSRTHQKPVSQDAGFDAVLTVVFKRLYLSPENIS